MLYAIICLDKPGALEVRKANRDAHLAHIRGADGAIVQGGPFLDADGEMCGSLLIYDGEQAGPLCGGRSVPERRDPGMEKGCWLTS
jgi:uncharacterized protein YciI